MTLSTDGSHKPYKKPNSTIKYVNKGSNHPPTTTKNIPSSIRKRLNSISSCEREFIDTKDEYQKALTDVGDTHELAYDTDHNKSTHKRKRKRRIVCFNPRYSKNVERISGKSSLTYYVSTFTSSILYTTVLTKTPLNYHTHVPLTWTESLRRTMPKFSGRKMVARLKMYRPATAEINLHVPSATNASGVT